MNIIPWRRNAEDGHGGDLERFFQGFWPDGDKGVFEHLPELFRNRPAPPVNIAESEDSYTITMDCPGLDEEDITVQAMGRQIVISGERKWEEEKKDKEFHRVESQYGRFQRTVHLAENASFEPDAIEASYDKGVLCVMVPKVEKTPTKRIPVRSG